MSYLNSAIRELFPEDTCEGSLKKDNHCTDGTDLYDILNSTSGSRKLMNILFSRRGTDPQIKSSESCAVNTEASKIAHQWIQEEGIESSRVPNASALQSESYIIFSWSRNSRPNTPQVIALPTDNEKMERLPSKKRESTNQKIYKCVYRGLSELESKQKTWKWIVHGVDNNNNNSDNSAVLVGENSEDDSVRPFDKLGFKVDPLATFVAQELPRDRKKKKDDDDEEENGKISGNNKRKGKSKRRSLLWFWGSKKSSGGKGVKSKDKREKRKSRLEEFASNPIDIDDSEDINMNDELGDLERYSKDGRGNGRILDTGDEELNTVNQVNEQMREENSRDLGPSGDERSTHLHAFSSDAIGRLQASGQESAEESQENEETGQTESDSDFGDFEVATPSRMDLNAAASLGGEFHVPSNATEREQRSDALLIDIGSEPRVESSGTPSVASLGTFTLLQPRKRT